MSIDWIAVAKIAVPIQFVTPVAEIRPLGLHGLLLRIPQDTSTQPLLVIAKKDGIRFSGLKGPCETM